MTERFEVPDKLIRVYVVPFERNDPREPAVHVNDVPGIVRAEVERALEALTGHCGHGDKFAYDYLHARFPECNCGGNSPHGVACNLSADPQRTVAAELNDRLEPRPTLASLAGKYPDLTLAKDPVFSPAERDTLKRLETFCLALAEFYDIFGDDPRVGNSVVAAARNLLT